jgi:nucleoside-diphosphate-sugar epimerase
MAGSTAIIGGGLVGGVIARQLRESGRDTVIIKDVGPTDEIALPAGTRTVFITAQSRDSHRTVASADLIFVNTGLVTKALVAAHSRDVEEVCFFSTGSVYRAQRRPFREDDPLDDAPGPYAKSKIAAENIVRNWACHFRRTLILRPFMIYGPGLGARRLLARLPSMVREGCEITLAEGKGFLTNPVHAEDVARCAIQLMGGTGLAFFNLGGRQILSLRDIVTLMAAELDLTPRFADTVKPFEFLIGDIRAMCGAGAVPKIEAHTGLRDYYRSFSEQRIDALQ